jgi:hypothetical protein
MDYLKPYRSLSSRAAPVGVSDRPHHALVVLGVPRGLFLQVRDRVVGRYPELERAVQQCTEASGDLLRPISETGSAASQFPPTLSDANGMITRLQA